MRNDTALSFSSRRSADALFGLRRQFAGTLRGQRRISARGRRRIGNRAGVVHHRRHPRIFCPLLRRCVAFLAFAIGLQARRADTIHSEMINLPLVERLWPGIAGNSRPGLSFRSFLLGCHDAYTLRAKIVL